MKVKKSAEMPIFYMVKIRANTLKRAICRISSHFSVRFLKKGNRKTTAVAVSCKFSIFIVGFYKFFATKYLSCFILSCIGAMYLSLPYSFSSQSSVYPHRRRLFEKSSSAFAIRLKAVRSAIL